MALSVHSSARQTDEDRGQLRITRSDLPENMMVENPMAVVAPGDEEAPTAAESPVGAANQQSGDVPDAVTKTSPDDAKAVIAAALAAQRSVAPLNMHQVTVYYCCTEERSPIGLKVFFMALTYLLIGFQCAVCLAVQAGIEKPSCRDNTDCKDSPREVCEGGMCGSCEGAYRTPNKYFARSSSVFNATHLQMARGVTDRYRPCQLGYVDPENDIIHGITRFNYETEEWMDPREAYYDGCFLEVQNNILLTGARAQKMSRIQAAVLSAKAQTQRSALKEMRIASGLATGRPPPAWTRSST